MRITFRKFTAEQAKIYSGLNSIGESMGNFYMDAVRLVQPDCNLASKANMIAHMAREIDGGLRDVFAPKVKGKNPVNKCPTCDQEIKASTPSHFDSIIKTLGTNDPQHALAKEWYATARQFHSITHRANIHLGSKDAAHMIELWQKYEKVLLTVIGSYLSLTGRLDVIMREPEPASIIIEPLKNLLTISRNAQYFYTTLAQELWLRPLKVNGFFSTEWIIEKQKDAESIEYWYPIQYLLRMSTTATGKRKAIVIEIVGEIMESFVKGEIKLHEGTITDLTRVIINLEDFSFREKEHRFYEAYSRDSYNLNWSSVHSYLFEGLVPKFLKNGDKDSILNLLDYLFGFSTYKEASISFFDLEPAEPRTQHKPFVEKYFLREILHKHGRELIQVLGADAIDVPATKLEALAALEVQSFHSLASIEPSNQNKYSDDWEDQLVNFIRDFAVQLDKPSLYAFTERLLKSKSQILQRIGTYLTNEYFDDFSNLWWEYLERTTDHDNIYIHEGYELLKKHSKKFTDNEIAATIEWIERINPPCTYKFNGSEKDIAAYTIRRWFTALQPSSGKAQELLAEKNTNYSKKNSDQMTDHPEFSSFVTSTTQFKEPMANTAFERMAADEQLKYIQNFLPEHEHDGTEEGLAKCLRNTVSKEPEKYLYILNDFASLHSLYIQYLLEGFTRAIKQNKTDEFLLPLNFIELKFTDENYINEKEKPFHFKRWLGPATASFIDCVLHNHERLDVNITDLERIAELIFLVLDKEEMQDDNPEIQGSYIEYLWNSIGGKLYGALFRLLNVWKVKVTKNDILEKWPQHVKEYFTRKISSGKISDKDFSIALCTEIPFVLSHDPAWLEENTECLFAEEANPHFHYRIQATFSSLYRPSILMYEYLNKHRLFKKAVNQFEKPGEGLKTLIDYALLEWRFWNGDLEKDSILSMLFEKKNLVQLTSLIDSAYQQELDKARITYLWKRLMSIANSESGLNGIYQPLSWFFQMQTSLDDDIYNLTVDIIKNSKADTTGVYTLLKHIFKIADGEIISAGKLVLMIYEKKLVKHAFPKEVQDFVSKLYQEGHKNLADSICVAESETGSLFLKDLYSANN